MFELNNVQLEFFLYKKKIKRFNFTILQCAALVSTRGVEVDLVERRLAVEIYHCKEKNMASSTKPPIQLNLYYVNLSMYYPYFIPR